MDYLKSIREWSSGFSSPFAEGAKEAIRITLFSIPAEFIAVMKLGKIDYNLLIFNLSIIFLRALDKYWHEKGKEKGYKKITPMGISPI